MLTTLPLSSSAMPMYSMRKCSTYRFEKDPIFVKFEHLNQTNLSFITSVISSTLTRSGAKVPYARAFDRHDTATEDLSFIYKSMMWWNTDALPAKTSYGCSKNWRWCGMQHKRKRGSKSNNIPMYWLFVMMCVGGWKILIWICWCGRVGCKKPLVKMQDMFTRPLAKTGLQKVSLIMFSCSTVLQRKSWARHIAALFVLETSEEHG